MITNPQALESMQSDILGVLQHAPALLGHVFADNEGDFESRLEKSLGTKTAGSTGRRGLAIIVMPVEVSAAESNLPGPPMMLRVRVLVMENISINRSASRGTLQPSSQAALNILNALQLYDTGGHTLFADKSPMTPQPSIDGISSHMVTMYIRSGMNPINRPSQIHAEMIAGELHLSCSTPGSVIHFTADGAFPARSMPRYTAPIAGLSTGAVIRAAAYVTGQPPSDVAELTVAG